MQRRSFLKKLVQSVVLAPLVCGLGRAIFPKPEPDEPEIATMYQINPEWEKAGYEINFLSSLPVEEDGFLYSYDPNPIRYTIVNGIPVQVSRFIEVAV